MRGETDGLHCTFFHTFPDKRPSFATLQSPIRIDIVHGDITTNIYRVIMFADMHVFLPRSWVLGGKKLENCRRGL